MINAAVVGLGWWGKHVCRALTANSKSMRVVRGIELDPDPVVGLAKEIGFQLSSDFQDALDDPGVDGVILTTPHSTHEELVLRAAAAGSIALDRAARHRPTKPHRAPHPVVRGGLLG